MVVFTNFICVSKYLSVFRAEAAIEQMQKLRKKAPAFCTLFFAHFNNQTTRRTDDEPGFIAQHKLNQVFEYSNNEGKNS